MAGKGGKRPGAGRKSNAQKLLEAGFVCDFFSPDFQERTWKSMLNSEDEGIKLKAAMYITDRLYGKAIEKKEVSGPDGAAIPMSIEIDL